MASHSPEAPIAVDEEKLDTVNDSPGSLIEPPIYSRQEEKALVRKLDLRLLPPLTLLYLLSFLDRSNVANARIEGLATDLGISGDLYLTGLTLYFVGYVLFEIPANIVLKRTSPRAWLPTLTLVWGIVTTLQGITQNLGGFYAVRFFLGVAESGLFPGVVFFLSMWSVFSPCSTRLALNVLQVSKERAALPGCPFFQRCITRRSIWRNSSLCMSFHTYHNDILIHLHFS